MDGFNGQSPHRPLSESDPKQIRLVKLFPGKFEDTIRCELEHVSLSSNPTFAALSYTWGDPGNTSPIVLNGQDYHVTRNLEFFLRHMQSILNEIANARPKDSPPVNQATLHLLFESFYRCVEDEPAVRSFILTNFLRDIQNGELGSDFLTPETRETTHQILDDGNSPDLQIPDSSQMYLSIWIDALCINQQNIAERNWQVALMGDIYKSTRLVYVWAGSKETEPDVNASDAFSVVDDLTSHWGQILESTSDESPTESMVRYLCSPEFLRSNNEAIQNLSRFLRIPWFSRAWILQEVVLPTSRRRIQLWFGFRSINFNTFIFISPLCCEVLSKFRPFSLTNTMHSIQYGERVLRARLLYSTFLGDDGANKPGPCSREIAVRLLRLLTVACPGVNLTDPRDMIYSLLGMLATNHLPNELQPNYALSASSIYHMTSAFLLSALGSEALDFFLSSRERMANVPSWVPNFVRMPPVAMPKTTNDRQDVAVSSDLTGLELRIVVVQHIVSVAIPSIPGSTYNFELHESVSVLVPTLGKVFAAFEHQVLSELENGSGIAPQHCANTWSVFWKRKMGSDGWAAVEKLVQASKAEYPTLDFNQRISDSKLFGLLMALEHMSSSGMAVTQDAHLIYPMRPTRLKVGDKLCTIRGVSEPCILRQRGDKYIFISLCTNSTLPTNGAEESEKMREELARII